MSKLVIPPDLLQQIQNIVAATDTETGVRLFGAKKEQDYLIKHIIGPGKNAEQEMYSYECDNEYAEEMFNKLLQEDVNIKFIGELHVHPSGYPHLSGPDRETIRKVLNLKEYNEFIAGVMQRNPFRMYPILFPQEQPMEVLLYEHIYEKPRTTPAPGGQAHMCGWMWERWLRHLRDARKGRSRQTDAD